MSSQDHIGNANGVPFDRSNALQAIVLFIALGLWLYGQSAIISRHGWWADEYYALWASDPSLSFGQVFTQRIAPDTNPPLYFSLLYLTRLIVDDPLVAVLTLNFAALFIGVCLVVRSGAEAGILKLATGSCLVFALCGPAMSYLPEGRTYFLSLVHAFVASWFVALSIYSPARRPSLMAFALLGAIGAMLHVYSALVGAVLAAGLLLVGISRTFANLIWPALVLGATSVLCFAIWFASIHIQNQITRVSWLELSPTVLREAFYFLRNLIFGSKIPAAILIALAAFAALDSKTRPYVLCFGTALALFIALPVLTSLMQPIVMGRYWMIGAPMIIPFMAFLLLHWSEASQTGAAPFWPRLAMASLAAATVASLYLGYRTAFRSMEIKSVWRGAEVVHRYLADCDGKKIHVGVGKLDHAYGVESFALAAGAPVSLFTDAGAPEAPTLAPASSCPVLGWIEHSSTEDLPADDAELLAKMKLKLDVTDVEIMRHRSGLVILRRDRTNTPP